jgi:tRNA-dihydrouridine synthase B
MLSLTSPLVLAPMAGMTDTAFRRLVKRQGGCGLVVSEMVSSEAIIRGIDRTLAYAEYTEEERPVAIQIFGGHPEHMAEAAQAIERMGADSVDVNMGCPVPKIAKHSAGCSLMREPELAARIVAAMAKAVRIPVTVKMRAGWDANDVNAPALARMVEEAGAAAVAVHGRTAAQGYHGKADWDLVARVAEAVSIPVFGSGDLLEPEDIVLRLRASPVAGVLVGRGILRNPWLFAQAHDLITGRAKREVTREERGRFLLDYIDLLVGERVNESSGFRHSLVRSPGPLGQGIRAESEPRDQPFGAYVQPLARGRDRWVINKLRALCAWYTKGFDNGSHLRVAVNKAESVDELRDLVSQFFGDAGAPSL